ncbi:MAG: Hsp20/alpha crystallin family protein [Phycisphaerae bacterium]|nr:Hsp20/alpha crystallin family protein [Phycisphaerae bacterium]
MFARRFVNRHPLNGLREEVDRLFTDFFQDVPMAGRLGLRSGSSFPAINAWDDAQNLYVEAELPGLKLEDIEVLVVGDEVTIKGERKDAHQEGALYHRRERGVGGFSRTLRLPSDVDADRVEASLLDGVLLVTLPKAEAAKPRKVQVKALTK